MTSSPTFPSGTARGARTPTFDDGTIQALRYARVRRRRRRAQRVLTRA